MAIKFVSIKCPECGANLDAEEGRKTMFCSYCGRKIMIVDDNEYKYEVTHRYIDEAKIREVEEEAKRNSERDNIGREKFNKITDLAACVIMALILIAFMIFGYCVTH